MVALGDTFCQWANCSAIIASSDENMPGTWVRASHVARDEGPRSIIGMHGGFVSKPAFKSPHAGGYKACYWLYNEPVNSHHLLVVTATME